MLKSRAMIQTIVEPEPTLESVAPEWVELNGKLQELLAREEDVLATIREKKTKTWTLGGGASPITQIEISDPNPSFDENNIGALIAAAEAEGKPPRLIGASKRAADLLGRFTPDPVPAPTPLSHEPKNVSEIRALGKEAAACREAITLLQPQVTKAHLEGSARLCALLKPKYGEIARRICAALVELGSADLAQREFMLKYRNVARATLRPVHATGSLGDPRDPQSELSRLLQWAAECGHFNIDDLSTEWGARKGGQIRSWPMT